MSHRAELTPSLEDYLETIYVLNKANDKVRVMDIAGHLDVTMASVTGGMKRLSKLGYIDYRKRRGIELTEKGEKTARIINRRHEELYSFFSELLYSDREEAQDYACKLEHVLSASLIERVIFLNQWAAELPEENRKTLERGMKLLKDIEAKPEMGKTTLDTLKPGEKAVITRVGAMGKIGKRMIDMGVSKGTEVEMIRVAPLGDPMDVRIKGYHLSLRKSEASFIEVDLK